MKIKKLFFLPFATLMLLGTVSSRSLAETDESSCINGKWCHGQCLPPDAACGPVDLKRNDVSNSKECRQGKLCGTKCIPLTSVCERNHMAASRKDER